MTERMLVCVNYGHNGTRLIRRALELAGASGAQLHVLVFDSQHDAFANDRAVDIARFQSLAEGSGATFAHVRGRSHDIIGTVRDAARERNATQIVIGQRSESLWSSLVGGSIVDVLLDDVPAADLHVVPWERADEPDEWEYEGGTRAVLHRRSDTEFALVFEGDPGAGDVDGVFFKEVQTDFDHGIFVFPYGGGVREVTVADGLVLAEDLESALRAGPSRTAWGD
ncbi:universal stress protein [Rhodococcus sp. HNM0569]|uniref:universal stress protein n=1 Tax=Rhodococcus sp. HNM0569 TaxID=2716340 RepID=UPI00146CC2B9|nr:universal stress protein [Rhodococcus sp. HNM0569]NLU84441.1 universal stress protein [Rhodococcus sp. HNM0569]